MTPAVAEIREFGMPRALSVLMLITSGALSTRAHAIVFGQIDDFQNGTAMNWTEGTGSLNPPTNIPTGGPAGAGDAFLQNASSGGSGPGSRQVMFNQTQWIGDYNSAGVTRLDAMMSNPGSADLYMRVTIRGGTNVSDYSSTNAILIPAGAGWMPVTFNLTNAGMSLVAGTDSLADVLGSVTTLRILSAQAAPSFMGDPIVATVNVDNLRALRLPGDANFDGVVNSDDFNALATSFGIASGMTWQNGDFNFDGAVTSDDFNLLATNFGLSAAAVPEPSAMLIGVPTSVGMCAMRRRRAR